MNLYGKYIEPIAETFGYCLLKNHFHCLVRIRSEEEIKTLKVPPEPLGSGYPSRQFSNLFNAYAKAINAAYGRTGSLFQHPFKRVMVTSDSQLLQTVRYIHQNPQKHGFVEDFREWKYSSYRALLSEKQTRLQRDIVLGWCGGKQSYIEFHSGVIDAQDSIYFSDIDDDID
jgi:REP element-mobilizing transposase RayT